ncbi:hypothetical protein ACFVHR_24875 [Streptomyces sp. NPDC127168]|uniref:hypothetical protein n=1 Tax=unclassified Streptomyces TaxID=2593676 RepID=UPI0036336DCE
MHGTRGGNRQQPPLSEANAVEKAAAAQTGVLAVITVDDPGTTGFAEALEKQLHVVRNWWAAGEGFVEAALEDVTERHDIERFLHRLQLRETPADVPLVLYLSSHGVLAPTQRHFMRLPATDDSRLPATGMPTNDLIVAALSSHSRHVLVIVNACHAGAIAQDLHAWWEDLMPDPARTLHVIATTDSASQVQALQFAEVLRRAYERLRRIAEITRPYLSIGEFLHALQEATAELNSELGHTDPYRRLSGPHTVSPLEQLAELVPTLPNPGYRRAVALVDASRHEVSSSVDDLEAWLRTSTFADPGWYVAGRPRLNRKVADFLDGPAGILIVAGAAASGKSSLLTRAVTLSEPTIRSIGSIAAILGSAPPVTVPPVAAIDIAVTGRNRSSCALLEAIARSLPGVQVQPAPPGRDPLRHWQGRVKEGVTLASGIRPLTLVIDAFDETDDPAACIRDVLHPLIAYARGQIRPARGIPAQNHETSADRPRVRIMLAVRASRQQPSDPPPPESPQPTDLLGELCVAFPFADVLRTDEADVSDDIIAYVHAALSTPAWASTPMLRNTAAREVANYVGHSFLDARIAAEQLADAGPTLLGSAAWTEQLHQGTVGLLHRDLNTVSGPHLTPETALALLRATTFARGSGLPRADIWPTVTTVLSPYPLDDADSAIDALLKSRLAGYLTHDIEDDRRVYRPAHEHLARLLHQWPTRGEQAVTQPDPDPLTDPMQQEHRLVTEALTDLARRDPAGQPHPYLARHLAQHAASAGLLDDDHLPPALLPWITGDTIRGHLYSNHTGQSSRTWLTAWATIEPFVQHADLPSRCSSLHLAHTVLHPGAHADEPQPLRGSRIRVIWSQLALADNVLVTTRQVARALASIPADGTTTILAIGSESGHVDLLDARTGRLLGDRITAHDGAVRRLMLLNDGARTALITASTDGHVRIWDATSRLLIDQFLRRSVTWAADITGYVTADQRLTIVAVNGAGEMTQWREGEGERRLAVISAHPLEHAAFAVLATTNSNGERILVCAGETLRIWQAHTFALLADHPLASAVRTLADTAQPGRIATGHQDGTITIWSIDGDHSHSFRAQDEPVTVITSFLLDDHPFLAVARAASIDLWDLSGNRLAGHLTGHTDMVTAIQMVNGATGICLVSSARDHTVRTWHRDALTTALAGAEQSPVALTSTVGPAAGAERTVLAVSYLPPRIQAFDAVTGHPGPILHLSNDRPATALVGTTTNDGNLRLIYTTADRTIHTWTPAAADTDPPPLRTDHLLPIETISACRTADDRTLVLSGSSDYSVRLWDLTDCRHIATWKHELGVRAVVAAAHPDGTGLYLASGSADGTARLWQPGQPSPQHTLRCQQGIINALTVNLTTPDGPLLATAGDATIRLWNLTNAAAESAHLTGHTDTIEALAAWSSAHPVPRHYLASAARDGTVRIWDTTTHRCVLQLATGSRTRALSAEPHPDRPTTLTLTGEAGIAVLELHLEG